MTAALAFGHASAGAGLHHNQAHGRRYDTQEACEVVEEGGSDHMDDQDERDDDSDDSDEGPLDY